MPFCEKIKERWRDKALTELVSDAGARRAFLYWTWTFNAMSA